MVKQVLWAVLFLNTVFLQAQTFEKAVFTHKVSRETRTLNAGDRLKVTYKENGDWTAVKGRLHSVENDLLILEGKPGIPLYSIDTIRYRAPGLRGIVLTILLVGMALVLAGFIFGLAAFGTPELLTTAGWLLGIGYGLLFASWIALAIGTHRIRDAGSEWDVVTVETPKQQVP